ncbi:YopX family protein [Acinetobacter sp. P8-3-8]|uniref:YopX family protein n=1 Tax=Acinetobacter sp. P8-3-8 TaxID=1029823 RepID=UPI00024856F0|nr:YopX family protein [Acinetobacter sp. P8-3-8]
MDINKERAAFEASLTKMKIHNLRVGTIFDTEKNEYFASDVLHPSEDHIVGWINFSWRLWQEKATPEGFVLVPKTESTGLTDKKGRIIFVGDVVEFVGGCVEFLDLSGYGLSKYIVNKGDKMIVRKLKSGYTLSLPWIDCDTPNRAGNLGNYDFWNLQRDFVVIEAQEQSHDNSN